MNAISKFNKKYLFLLACAIVLISTLLYFITNQSYEHINKKKILVIQSYSNDYSSYPIWNREIRDAFDKINVPVEIKTVYLDCEKFNDEEELEHMNMILDCIKKHNWDPDLIMVNDDQGCFSFLSCGHEWADKKPVVFGGVNYPNKELLARHPNVTGFHDSIVFEENLKIINEFQKKKNKYFYIMFFLDSTYLEKKIKSDMNAFLETHKQEYNYIDKNVLIGDSDNDYELSKVYSKGHLRLFQQIENSGDKINIFLTRVRKESAANLMWNCSLHKYIVNNYLKLTSNVSTETAEDLCKMPKFTAINEQFASGNHFVAGYITTLHIQANEMAGVAKMIFNGTSPADIPIQKSKKEYVADWEAMKFYKISPSEFGDRFHIVNMPFYIKYKWAFIVLAVIFLMWNVFFIFYLHEKQKKERRLKEKAQTELVEANKKLVESLDKLKDQYDELQKVRELVEKAELKQSFINSMSHEIRTPLNAIVGFSDLLVDESVSAQFSHNEKKEFIKQIQINTKLLLKLVNDILDISQIESGDIPINIKKCSSQEIINTIYDEWKNTIKNKSFVLENDKIESTILVDPIRFKQVISNLISNADKFTKEGSITLGCQLNDNDKTICIYVRDTGIGISEEECNLIFHRFYKINPFSQGTGLGLSICQTIMKKMNGSMFVQSELGKGSCFYVTIPVAED